jgi:hypothetical protein
MKETIEREEVYVLKEGQLKRLESLAARNEKTAEVNAKAARDYQVAAAEVSAAVVAGLRGSVGAPTNHPAVKAVNSSAVYRPPTPVKAAALGSHASMRGASALGSRPAVAPLKARDSQAADPGELNEYAMSLLRTLAERAPMQLTWGQLAALSGKSARSSSFDAARARMRKVGVVDERGDRVTISDAGRALAGTVRTTPTTPDELREAWLGVLPDYERELLRVLLDVYPSGLTREELGERAGKSPASSSFDAAMASLKRNGLIDGVRGDERASPKLLEAAGG